MRFIRQLLLVIAFASVTGLSLGDAVAQSPGYAREGVDVHFVTSGETLYHLAGRYLGDQRRWPELWGLNPHITNPHFLYPGDVVFLRPGVTLSEAPGERITRSADASRLTESSGHFFPVAGVYTSEELPVAGRLAFARSDRALLNHLDEVYLEIDEDFEVEVGDELVVQRVEGRVYEDKELVGVRYRSTGRLQITEISEDYDLVTGVITALYDTIERDDVLFAARPQLVRVAPTVATETLEGSIIDAVEQLRHFSAYNVVFIDRGLDDGVRVGNRLQVWEREDMGAEAIGLARGSQYAAVQERLPWQNVGEGIVIETNERFSTVALLNTSREITVGHRFTITRGL